MFVLVGYASEHGATRQIAERVASLLLYEGVRAEARPMAEVGDADRYDAFVLGSAVRRRRWLREGTRFVRRNRAVLAGRPVWLFSVGTARVRGGRLDTRGGARGGARGKAPRAPGCASGPRGGVRVRDHRFFPGVVMPGQLSPAGRLLRWAGHGRYGDFRNWPEIDDWAAGIARSLPRGPRPPAGRRR
ncbi:flavodoxin domain-containing protein [Streptomyces thermolineatus]|uniref:Flavodoxin domain-containing protein n=1 Tax=Streptomyces thermolineatus TaxID=44033 RepID=A0ABP5Z9J7_9ACTN